MKCEADLAIRFQCQLNLVEKVNGKKIELNPIIVSLVGFCLMAGCATTPNYLGRKDTDIIKKLAIVMVLQDKELKVFDHTGVWKKTYTYNQFGLVGALVETAAFTTEANIRIRSSLGGDPKLLREQLGDYSLTEILERDLMDKISKRYEIVNTNEAVKELREAKENQKIKIEDYLDVCNKAGADTMLKVDYSYGLAAYARAKASAAIVANISVYNVRTNALLMNKVISSDNYFKNACVVTQYSANDAELFRKDMLEAVNGLSLLIATEFGVRIKQEYKPEKDSGKN